ncbi:MAG: acylphosphatase [Rhodospirillales bacterium]|nr:acylphosphatase [Rhodospirillales bacterium]
MTESLSQKKTVNVRIEGRVQGVWYRGWTVQQALSRGLNGWVRNRSDGSVEAVFCGPAPVVDELIEACWQGPTAANVRRIVSTPEEQEVPEGFFPLPTL